MLKTLWMLNIREIKRLYQDKKALLIVLLLPIIYTSLFGYLYINNIVTDISTAVINHSPSQLSRSVVEGFNKTERFDVKYYLDNEKEIRPLLEKGEVDVVLIIPKDFTRNIKKGQNSHILLGVNASNMIKSNATAASAMQIVKTFSAGITVKKFQAKGLLGEQAYNSAVPISFNFRPWYNPTYSYTNYLLLGIIAVALQQVSLMYIANSFAKEREDNTIQEFLSHSKSASLLILGKSMPYFLIGLLNLIATTLLAFKVFSIPLRGNFFYILLMGIPFFIAIIGWGVLISLICKSEVEATQLVMLLAYPTFLISGFTWPLIAMPELLKNTAYLVPLTYFAENLRKIALMGISFEILKTHFYYLSVLSCAFLLIAIVTFRWKFMGTPKIFESYSGERGLSNDNKS